MSEQKENPGLNLLDLPPELRDEIWALCLMLPDDTVVCITERASFSCNDHKELTTALLRVNQQMHHEAKAILYSRNTFSIKLNEQSCMRKIRDEKPKQYTFAIPSLWKSAFRKNIYQIRRLHITVALSREELKEGLSQEEENYQLQRSKSEFSDIVQNAVEELCNVLALSSSLTKLRVSFRNNGRQSMRTDKDHRVLQPLGKLRGLKEVEIIGVPKNFALYLEDVMKRKSGR